MKFNEELMTKLLDNKLIVNVKNHDEKVELLTELSQRGVKNCNGKPINIHCEGYYAYGENLCFRVCNNVLHYASSDFYSSDNKFKHIEIISFEDLIEKKQKFNIYHLLQNAMKEYRDDASLLKYRYNNVKDRIEFYNSIIGWVKTENTLEVLSQYRFEECDFHIEEKLKSFSYIVENNITACRVAHEILYTYGLDFDYIHNFDTIMYSLSANCTAEELISIIKNGKWYIEEKVYV